MPCAKLRPTRRRSCCGCCEPARALQTTAASVSSAPTAMRPSPSVALPTATLPPPHTPACRLAHWLRVFGGPAEVQRQVDAAHEAALREADTTRRVLEQLRRAPRPTQTVTFSSDAIPGDEITIDGVRFVATGRPGEFELREGRPTADAIVLANAFGEQLQFSPRQPLDAGRSRVPPVVAQATGRKQRRERRR